MWSRPCQQKCRGGSEISTALSMTTCVEEHGNDVILVINGNEGGIITVFTTLNHHYKETVNNYRHKAFRLVLQSAWFGETLILL